ncbi:unnamed protein product [Acanthoscelides obtectus]|uniref:Uncharacterized protein n=1 Tax=Acanthoscelides obtectus TaxID=200917 RepID=A0A9P0JT92_ACAOB|nr:unnamed protein product [Acanthoscelides obtectus]CAK1679005.1 hypothetical protein AOBTE_LOCUS32090 [Acanthoscelides obtectus]
MMLKSPSHISTGRNKPLFNVWFNHGSIFTSA